MSADSARFSRAAAEAELERIASWWAERLPDEEHGGFVGEIDAQGILVPGASKGIILNSRLLWFFSEMARHGDDDRFAALSTRAYRYLVDHFDDPEHGGAVWELDPTGEVLVDRKQIYAICFCIYALCARFDATGDTAALDLAHSYVEHIEKHARDKVLGGYVEAFTRDWQVIGDFRLGIADLDSPKTMNTHLHLLEAYTALHRSSPNERSAALLHNAIDLLCNRILDRDTGHLGLFFDYEWRSQSAIVSYGHDIEASWLLWEAAEVLGDEKLLRDIKPDVLQLATRSLDEGIGHSGQLCNEFNPLTNERDENAIWWVQAEALVGFLRAWRLSGSSHFRDAADEIWRFICRYQADFENGDWHWFAQDHGPADPRPYKAGFWKAPYHNGRAMLESIRLFDAAGM